MNTHYQRITLMHANLKRPVQIILGTIAGYHESTANQCTHVYTTAGVFPTTETPAEIDKKIDEIANKGEENGVSKCE